MTYDKLIKELTKLARQESSLQWAYGDLLVQWIPASYEPGGRDRGIGRKLLQVSKSLGGSPTSATLRNYRDTVIKFPPADRKNASWCVHFLLKSHRHKHLVKDGMTVDQALKIIGRKMPETRHAGSFAYTCELLDSASRFLQAGARYMERNNPQGERLEVIAEHINKAESALEELLEAAGMTEESDLYVA